MMRGLARLQHQPTSDAQLAIMRSTVRDGAADRPGIYRFIGGRLASMERVAEPMQARKPQKPAKTAKKTAPRQ